MSDFSIRLKELRKGKHLTQKQLANMLFIDDSSISKYENGRATPEHDLLQKLADFFNVSIDYLLGRTDKVVYKEDKNQQKKEREVTKIIDNMRKELKSAEGLMFNGNPASPEAIESILDAMRIGIEIANERNKKYIPKKYRKDKE